MASPLEIYGLKPAATPIHTSSLTADFSELNIPRGSLRGSRQLGRGESDHSSSSELRMQCVCFDLKPELHYIEMRDEIPEDVLEGVWYNEDEVKQMIASATGVLAGSNTEDAIRGLEHYSFEGAQRRRLERSKASEAVLGEQLRQQAAKACENKVFANADDLIRAEYVKVSQKQQELAYERAREDAAEASDNKFLHRSLSAVKKWFSSDRQLVQPV